VHDEYAATIRDGHHWSHEAVYWLFHEAGTDLGIALPAGAHLDRILLDGADVTPLNTEPDHLWLSLAGAGGIRCLSVSWLMDSLHESLERPNLSKPLLEDSFHAPLTPAGNGHAASGPPSALAGRNSLPRINATTSYWALQIPPGYHLIQARGDSVPDSPTGHELRRAAALLELSRELAIRGAEKMEGPFGSLLSATQEEFHRSCRYAQY